MPLKKMPAKSAALEASAKDPVDTIGQVFALPTLFCAGCLSLMQMVDGAPLGTCYCPNDSCAQFQKRGVYPLALIGLE